MEKEEEGRGVGSGIDGSPDAGGSRCRDKRGRMEPSRIDKWRGFRSGDGARFGSEKFSRVDDKNFSRTYRASRNFSIKRLSLSIRSAGGATFAARNYRSYATFAGFPACHSARRRGLSFLIFFPRTFSFRGSLLRVADHRPGIKLVQPVRTS